ncbi:hypothetical protein D8B29_08865 [Verminephrobacter eiseniae]|nr:hypothetical protein [Verminephrobacter eiseniae]MCW5285711.1 hypothetical protein [Verminephrobacter eiseniae]MCW5304011.1 hypothetical protein [Verminephrobacter eiseniae]MCW8179721.1 hypothetical protein [Verminephrobacter eiseniae]MCW8190378.1 hypothetical protein [Verminephrobacter eiseniae]
MRIGMATVTPPSCARNIIASPGNSTVVSLMRQIAMLGGFLGRKCDGQPGVKSLWLGFARVRDFVQGVEHMRLLQDAGGSCV